MCNYMVQMSSAIKGMDLMTSVRINATDVMVGGRNTEEKR